VKTIDAIFPFIKQLIALEVKAELRDLYGRQVLFKHLMVIVPCLVAEVVYQFCAIDRLVEIIPLQPTQYLTEQCIISYAVADSVQHIPTFGIHIATTLCIYPERGYDWFIILDSPAYAIYVIVSGFNTPMIFCI